ncbi:MAG: nucleotidyltransferase family protein [Proteobacteria bacterium]|nr:nucleotidyltransferase family protein [Pseudomonadota bacterium]
MITPESTPHEIHILVLAAGGSSRFGSPKQLVRFHGRPLLHAAVTHAVEAAGNAVTVVLGANAAELAPLLRHTPASIAINRDWSAGLASSIRTGLARLPGTADAALIMLADQPFVTSEDLRRLIATARRNPDSIVAALYDGTAGVPAIFPRANFRELSELRGDQGARALLRRHSTGILRLPMPDASIDIDTPEDLLRLEG